MKFATRSYEEELLDQSDIPFTAIKRNMQELDVINTWLGGHHITLAGFKALAGNQKKISVCEIGCGGGDNLKAIAHYAKKKGIELNITGIDIKKECIDYARQNGSMLKEARWICSDFRHAILPQKPDIIFSSLFCHHFDDDGVIEIIRWMKSNAKRGFFINDLHRHPLAYYSIKLLTALFSKSYLVKNDAPLSVRRGFRKPELEKLTAKSLNGDEGIVCRIHWKWAFRWLAIFYLGDHD